MEASKSAVRAAEVRIEAVGLRPVPALEETAGRLVPAVAVGLLLPLGVAFQATKVAYEALTVAAVRQPGQARPSGAAVPRVRQAATGRKVHEAVGPFVPSAAVGRQRPSGSRPLPEEGGPIAGA